MHFGYRRQAWPAKPQGIHRAWRDERGGVGGQRELSGTIARPRRAEGQTPPDELGYGPLVPKGDLALPAEFNYQVLDRQGIPMRDDRPTPGIFDAMGAYPDVGGPQDSTQNTDTTTEFNSNPPRDTTILIRNHENRERAGEIKVVTGPGLEYDETAFGGCTKLVVERERAGTDPATGQQLYTYTVADRFAILGGTSTNCAGGELPFKKWMTCEEVVKRMSPPENRLKHGYNFEVDAMADGPVPTVPIPQMAGSPTRPRCGARASCIRPRTVASRRTRLMA